MVWRAVVIALGCHLVLSGVGSAAEDKTFPEPYPWDTSVCEEGECPTRYVIEGFDVRISPTVYEAPDFTHAALGRELDILKAQLLWMTSHNAVPKTAIRQLIDSEVSIYLDVSPNWSEWWPCSRDKGAGGACYSPRFNRVGIRVRGAHVPYPNKYGQSALVATHTWESVALHELAHAYHYQVVLGGPDNVCIQKTYEKTKHLYQAVEKREQVVQDWNDGVPIHKRPEQKRKIIMQHYAAASVYEYFAELSKAMWAWGDYYPWNRNELWDYDRESYMLIWNAWHDPKGFCPEQKSLEAIS